MTEIIAKIEGLLRQTTADRMWFSQEARRTGQHGLRIDAAACAIREKSLRDVISVLRDVM